MSNDEEKKRPAKRWTPEEKLRVVLSAAAVGEAGLGALLRSEGLHEADLTRFPAIGSRRAPRAVREEATWRLGRRRAGEAAREGAPTQGERARRGGSDLVLRKKVQALWGEEGDDTTEDTDK